MPRTNYCPRTLFGGYAMPGKNDTIAWDTCIFLAWLKNETRAIGEMEGVAQSVADIEHNRINVIGSSLIYGEIYEARFSEDQRNSFPISPSEVTWTYYPLMTR